MAKEFHPGLGGNTPTMQEVNKEYAFAFAKAIKGKNLSEEAAEDEICFSEEYRQAIEKKSSIWILFSLKWSAT